MDESNATGGLDLNEPFIEDVTMFDDLQKEHMSCNNIKTSGKIEGSKKNSEHNNPEGTVNPD